MKTLRYTIVDYQYIALVRIFWISLAQFFLDSLEDSSGSRIQGIHSS